MMRVMIISLCLLFNTLNSYSAIEKHHLTIYFETDKDELTKNSIEKLQDFVSCLKTDDYKIEVRGHTDNRGANKYNQDLSKRRATRVHKYFLDNNMVESQLALKFKGENQPIRPNSNASNMSENRRVEISMTSYSFDNIADFENALKSGQSETFILQPDEPTVIMGKQGIRILIEKETFLYADGTPVTEPVEVELTEALSFADFITHNLATVSDKEQLESGGMFRLSATTASGREVKIDQFNPITVAVPSTNRQSNMQVFTSPTGGNWDPTGQDIKNKLVLSLKPKPMLDPHLRKLPKYRVDVSTKPKKPRHPRKPRMPSEVNSNNYTPNYTWYQVFSKKKIQLKYANRYERALANYDTRSDRFDKRIDRYETRVCNYDQDVAEFQDKLDTWYEDLEKDKAKFRKGTRYERVVSLNKAIYKKAMQAHIKKMVTWNALRETRMDELGTKVERLGIANASFMENYIFTFSKMSWINVDRFYKTKMSERQQITVNDPDASPEKVFIVFKKMKSMLPLNSTVNGYEQKAFPKGAAAALMAYKIVDGKPWIYYQDIGETSEYNMTFIPCKFEEIKAIFASIQA